MRNTRRAAAVVAASCLCATLTVPSAGAASAPRATTVTVAPGVVFRRTDFVLHEGKQAYPEQVLTLGITLSPHTSLTAAYPGDTVGAGRATLTTLAKQEHAVAGVSGNVFVEKDPHAAGDGGVSRHGVIVKSELKGKDDSLWVDSSGHAHIGDPGFTGYLTTVAGHHQIHISSVNYVDNGEKGAMTLLDYHEAPVALPSSCLLATIAPVATRTYRVQSVDSSAKRFAGVRGSTRALLSCGSHQAPWLATVLVPGTTLTGSWGYPTSVVTLMSGANHIVHDGRAYHDPTGIPTSIDWFQTKRVPEDFACVMRDSRQVLLGSMVGWQSYSAGMTYTELGAYLAGRGCTEAIALNALYDSTLVGVLPGKGLTTLTPRTSKGEQKLVSGLLVTTTN